MTHIPKAKPCPFCRSDAIFVEDLGGVFACTYAARCDGCAALGPPVEHGDYGDGRELEKRNAIKAWNKRLSTSGSLQAGEAR